MSAKIKVYLDSGAFLPKKLRKTYNTLVDFCHFPYDSSHTPSDVSVSKPSETQWRDANISWDSDFAWEEFTGSEMLSTIQQIVGLANNRRDILHLDSAFKTKCHIFVTSDKDDIYKKKEELEKKLGFKIFHYPSEINMLIAHLDSLGGKSRL